jgi:cell wall-associated NlpC family hydrolase
MRRPLLVFVLLATIAAGWAEAALAVVHWPSGGSKSGHPSHVQKLARKVVAYARHQVGAPYRWGGTSPGTGFDCSGLVYAAYRSIHWKIPRSSWDQLRVGRPVRFARLRPGDLLFTDGGGHVQLVVSKRAAISAPQTGERVRYVPLAQLRPEFAGARRVLK